MINREALQELLFCWGCMKIHVKHSTETIDVDVNKGAELNLNALIKTMVYNSLHQAVFINGYSEMLRWTENQVVADMMSFDSALARAGATEEMIRPHVRSYLEEHAFARKET